MEDKIRFYCPIKVPARGRVIAVIYITKNILYGSQGIDGI
jgi:hypothetical protein